MAARIKGQLDDFHAEGVQLEREEAAMALGLIEALIGILGVELKNESSGGGRGFLGLADRPLTPILGHSK